MIQIPRTPGITLEAELHYDGDPEDLADAEVWAAFRDRRTGAEIDCFQGTVITPSGDDPWKAEFSFDASDYPKTNAWLGAWWKLDGEDIPPGPNEESVQVQFYDPNPGQAGCD